jgi:DNA-binding transcriptional MerR regulator
MTDQTPLTIGEVINLLRDDFPDVSVSKVRFLESQGLLAPGRSEGGYRLFDAADIERIQYILRQQRDHFLPLKVIKSKLTLWDRGEEPLDPEPPRSARSFLDEPGDPVTRAEVLRKSGLTAEQFASLLEHALIAPEPHDRDLFSPRTVTVATEARQLFAQGLESRHLRAIRHAAEREAEALAQLTVGLLRMRNHEARQQAETILGSAGESMSVIHRALLADELTRILDR